MISKLMKHIAERNAIQMYNKKVLPFIKGKHILDFGAGNGLFIHHLLINCSKLGYEPIGVEIDEEKTKKYLTGLTIFKEVPEDIEVDTTTSFHVIEHIDNAHEPFRKIKKITKQRIIIITPDGDSNGAEEWMRNPEGINKYDSHKRLWGTKELKQLMKPEFKLIHQERINKSFTHRITKPITKHYNDILLTVFERCA